MNDFELRMLWKRQPDVAATRKERADIYRTIRAHSHPIARLVRKRVNESDERMWNFFWGANGWGGENFQERGP